MATTLPSWFTAEDLFGAAEIGLLEAADRYDPAKNDSFRAYARQRVYGACISAARRREYIERGHLSLVTDEMEAEPLCDQPSPEQMAAERQLDAREQAIVWARVQQLPSRHALVILAVYGGNMSLEQLATKVDVGASRLSQIHHEALRMLRDSCEERRAA